MLKRFIALLLTAAMLLAVPAIAEEETRFSVTSEYGAGFNQYEAEIFEGANWLSIVNGSDEEVYYQLNGDENTQPAEIKGTLKPAASYTAEFTAEEAGKVTVSAFGGAHSFSVCSEGMHAEELVYTVITEPGEETGGVAAFVCPLCGEILKYEAIEPLGNAGDDDIISTLPDLTYSFVTEDDLIIYLDRAALLTNTYETVNITVLWGESVTEDITVEDENGIIIKEIPNDNSGYCRFETVIYETSDRMGSFTARSGSHESVAVDFKVMGPLTEEMTERLFDVFEGAEEYAENMGLAGCEWSEAIEPICAYLDSCQNVASWECYDNIIIFCTYDGLTGAFEYEEEIVDAVGFSNEIDTFDGWYYDSEDVASKYIKSELAPTNRRASIYYPNTEAAKLDYVYEIIEQRLSKDKGTLWKTVDGFTDEDNVLVKTDVADFTKSGLAVFIAHGSEFAKTNGGDVVFFRLAERTKSEISAIYTNFYSSYVRTDSRCDDTDILICKEWNNSNNIFDGSHYVLKATSNYLKKVIGDKVFDNTIVYLVICHGLADDSLIQYMMSHGAACVLGIEHETLYGMFGSGAFIRFINELTTPDALGEYGTLADAKVIFEATYKQAKSSLSNLLINNYSTNRMWVWDGRQLDTPSLIREWVNDEIDDLLRNAAMRPTVKIRSGCEDMVIAGQSKLSGCVVCEMRDGTFEPVEGAKVTLYKWMNHSYTKLDNLELRTDAEGRYEADKIDVAHYGIAAEKEGGKATQVAELGKDDVKAKDIVLYKEVRGWVTEDDNKLTPIPGATVVLDGPEGRHEVLTTDADGYWFAKVTEAKYTVHVSCPGYNDETAEFSDFLAPTVMLTPVIRIFGIVTDAETGEPIPGAAVWGRDQIKDNGMYVETNPDGSFSVEMEAGLYDLTASAEGYKNSTATVLHVAPNDTYVSFALEPDQLVKLSGVITDKNTGRSIGGAAIRLCESTGNVLYTASSDASGRWELEVSKNEISRFSYATVKKDGYVTHKHIIINHADFDGFDAKLKPVPNIDFILVADTSGSMDGTPLSTLKGAAESFINDLFDISPDSNLAIIEYNTSPYQVSGFSSSYSRSSMLGSVSALRSGGNTDIAAALRSAASMAQSRYASLAAQGKGDTRIVVLFMSDGYPTCSTDSVYRAANELHALNYVDVYSVGFFHNMSSSERASCQNIMRYIAGSSTHFFTVSSAGAFSYIFGDVLRSLLVSPRTTITVDCPVDVSVTYLGETLDKNNTRTSFGTLQFEGENDERKVLRLDSENDYRIELTGTGSGYMDYTIRYTDEDGAYSDTRKIVGIPVEYGMNAYSETAAADETAVYSDLNDTVYTAAANEKKVYNYHSEAISAYKLDFAATASSYYEQNNPSVAPSQAIDGSLSTSWDSWGEYEKAWIALKVTDGYEYLFSGFTINNGKNVNKNRDGYNKNSRIMDCTVYIDGVEIAKYTLDDISSAQTFALPEPVTGSEFKLVVDTVYKGSKYTAPNYGVCITEIALW